MDLFSAFAAGSSYLPHGYCFSWTPMLLWSMVGADGVIAAAYFSIPLALITFARKRADLSLTWVAWLFSAFIFACGITHVMDIWTIWRPDYGLQAFTKTVTALISIATAIALWPLIPKALRIPSVVQLQAVIDSLQAEVKRRSTTEEQLVDLQQSLAVTLAGIGAGFIATDRSGTVTRMNAVAEQTLGWTEAAAQGEGLWRVFARDGHLPYLADVNQVDVMLEQGVSADTAHDVVAVSRDGTRVAMEVKTALTYSADGSVRGLAMVFRDMTRLLRAEAESSRLAAIVESSTDAIIGHTLDGHITSWNRAAQVMFGYSAKDSIGQRVQVLIPPDREDEWVQMMTKLARGSNVPAFETVCLTKESTRLEVSVTISPIRDAQGVIVGASKIARDVSHQRNVEAALRDSEARLRFALESAQIGEWELDLATGAIRRSLRHDQCFGYVELLSEWGFDTFVRHVHPDDRAEFANQFQVAVTDLKDWRVECRVVWPDGTIHWLSVHASSHDKDGVATRMLGIVSDVTEQKLVEDARLTAHRLEAENQQIQEASRMKSQFLANMSHELRTPLNAIIGFADLLHSGAVRDDSLKHQLFLGHIGTSGRHLLQLINDVLDLSKVESGKFEFFPQPVDLAALINEVGDVLHSLMLRKRIRLLIDVDPTLTSLVLDPARLRQALYNYLSNAIKFTPEGGAIKVRALTDGPAHFRIEVEDNGIGIAAVDLPRLFTDFHQLDTGYTKQHQGTGLGLALTRRLVRAQGGNVGVRSTLGRGSVFYLVLKRVQVVETEHPHAEQAPPSALPWPRVLVIDDDGRHQASIVHDLSDAGFQVDAASTGEQALRHVRGPAYDAITLDLMMPGQGGLAVLQSIRNEGGSRESPVVGMSMPAEDGTAVTFSIANVLSKPIRVDEVVRSMTRFKLETPGRANVMVIDDDAMALELMRSTLMHIGIEAVCLLDGRAALRDIEQHRPDAIILDLMMPEFDGFEVLDGLRQLPAWRDTPVFIWTSMLLTDEEYASLTRSAQAILSKGGGALHVMLDALRSWRPANAQQQEDLST